MLTNNILETFFLKTYKYICDYLNMLKGFRRYVFSICINLLIQCNLYYSFDQACITHVVKPVLPVVVLKRTVGDSD